MLDVQTGLLCVTPAGCGPSVQWRMATTKC